MLDPTCAPEPRRAYPSCAAFYAHLLPGLVAEARAHGYALATHGSMSTDLDLVAVPWVEDAAPADVVAEALRALVCGPAPDSPAHMGMAVFRDVTDKPHGRRSYAIYLDAPEHGPCTGPYIDLCVMPRLGDVRVEPVAWGQPSVTEIDEVDCYLVGDIEIAEPTPKASFPVQLRITNVERGQIEPIELADVDLEIFDL